MSKVKRKPEDSNGVGVTHTLQVSVPETWDVVPLETVLEDIVGGGTPSRDNPSYWNGSIPWLTVKDMRTRRPEDSIDHISDQAVRDSATNIIPADTVIIATRIGLGKVIRVPYNAAINQDLKALITKPAVDKSYLEYWIYSIANYLESIGSGTTVKGIRLEHVRSLPFPLAPLDQQKLIVAEIEKQFSRLDEAVANLKRVKANLKRYKAAVLNAATRGRFTNIEATRESGALPGDWRWITVKDLASDVPRSIQSGPFGSNLKHSEFRETGRLVIGIDNVQDGRFSIGAEHRISEKKFKELEKYAARPHDVLITVMATIGRVCVVPQDIEPAIITKHVYRITTNAKLVVPEYLAIALRGAAEVRSQLFGSVQGQTRPGLNGTLIKRIRIPIPPLAEQYRIVAEVDRRFSLVCEVETQVETNLMRAQALRQAILSKMFGSQP